MSSDYCWVFLVVNLNRQCCLHFNVVASTLGEFCKGINIIFYGDNWDADFISSLWCYTVGTERYELYADDRPVSPLKLLEIDQDLDWSHDIAAAIAATGDIDSDDDEYIFRSIREMSQALTR